MSKIVNELRSNEIILGFGMPLKKDEKITWMKSLFNSSQLFYLLSIFVVVILAICDSIELF